MLTKAEAEEVGKKALEKMPKGWEVEVWENLGWNIVLVRGPVAIYYHGADNWHCLIADVPNPTHRYGSTLWTGKSNGSSKTPLQAFNKEKKAALEAIAKLKKVEEILNA